VTPAKLKVDERIIDEMIVDEMIFNEMNATK